MSSAFRLQISLLCLFICGSFLYPAAATCQRSTTPPEDDLLHYLISPDEAGVHEYALWGGHSFHSSRGVWGQTAGVNLSMMGIRYNRDLLRLPGNYLLKYVSELNLFVRYDTDRYNSITSFTTLGGFGISPLGFQFNWNDRGLIQPYFKNSAGFMLLAEPFPNNQGTRFNFTLEIGPGIELHLAPNLFLTLGYRYHHMSNAQFGEINPGIDSNMFYGAITLQ